MKTFICIVLTAMLYFKSAQSLNPFHNMSSSISMVKLFYGVTTDNKGILTCEVTLPSETSTLESNSTNDEQPTVNAVYLICPQVYTSVCYMDCTPSCVLSERGCETPRTISDVIETCSYGATNATNIRVDYVINLRAINNTGIWDCDYRGQRAAQPIELRATESLSSTVIKTGPATPHTTERNSLHTSANSPPKMQAVKRNSNESEDGKFKLESYRKREPISSMEYFKFKLTRPEIIILMMICFSASLILNITLVVRCILMKTYIRNMAYGKTDRCLENLLCIHSTTHNKSGSRVLALDGRNILSWPSTSFVHYSTSPIAHRNAQTFCVQNDPLYTNPSLFGQVVDGSLINATVDNVMMDDPTDSMSSGPYSHLIKSPFLEDRRGTNQHPPSQQTVVSDTQMINVANLTNSNATGNINEHLTESIVVQNDSIKFPSDHLLPRNPSKNLLCTNVVHSLTNQNMYKCRQRAVGERTRLNFNRLTSPISPKRGGIFNSIEENMVKSAMTASLSTENMHNAGERGTGSKIPKPLMTPLVIRFSSGESGLLICPNRGRPAGFEGGSLPRNPRTDRLLHKINHKRQRPMNYNNRSDLFNSSYNADTESDSGCMDFVFVDTSSNEQSDQSKQTDLSSKAVQKGPILSYKSGTNLIMAAQSSSPNATSPSASTRSEDMDPICHGQSDLQRTQMLDENLDIEIH